MEILKMILIGMVSGNKLLVLDCGPIRATTIFVFEDLEDSAQSLVPWAIKIKLEAITTLIVTNLFH
jgi:hypothetical protein